MVADKSKISDKYAEYYFEQYKIYIAGMERISDRRESANRHFITLNSAILVLSGLVIQYTNSHKALLLLGLCGLGLVICVIFWFLINSYKQLNTAKFTMLHDMESKLPIEMYKNEWEILGEGKDKKKYFPFSHIERLIPLAFGLAYVVMATIIFLWRLG